MEIIKSKQNSQLKGWKKLMTAKARKKSQSYLIEGTHLAQEALKSNVPVKQWIMTQSYYESYIEVLGQSISPSSITVIEDSLAKELSATVSPQGVFAEVKIIQDSLEYLNKGKRFILLDQVQDPGNIGTIIRTADAAAYDAVIVGKGSADIYNDKLIRSTQGSIWHIDVIEMDLLEAINHLKQAQITIYVSTLNNEAKSYKQIQESDSCAIIVGNEGRGVSEEIISMADESIYIPMPGKSESLNVAIAAGILMFHFI